MAHSDEIVHINPLLTEIQFFWQQRLQGLLTLLLHSSHVEPLLNPNLPPDIPRVLYTSIVDTQLVDF